MRGPVSARTASCRRTDLRRSTRAGALATVLALPLALGSCSGSAPVEPPSPAGPALAACQRLSDKLPAKLDGLAARGTEPESAYTAAWGDPAVELRCGIERPALLDGTPPAVEIDGVGWVIEELEDGHRFTSTGRVAYVQVRVPDDYAPEVNVLVDLAPAMSSAVPTGPDPTPSPSPSPEAHPHGDHPDDDHTHG